jgi:GNAT superfamily N-acetyltransferase
MVVARVVVGMAVLSLTSSSRADLVVLDPSYSDRVTEMFGHVSTDSLYRRFSRQVVTVDQFRDALLKSDDFERLSLGAMVDGRLVAVAQYARRPQATTADMAILVADAWQRQDLGAQLVTALASLAKAQGVYQFAVSLQLDNPGASRLIRRLAPCTRLVLVGGGVAEAAISLVNINQSTLQDRLPGRPRVFGDTAAESYRPDITTPIGSRGAAGRRPSRMANSSASETLPGAWASLPRCHSRASVRVVDDRARRSPT